MRTIFFASVAFVVSALLIPASFAANKKTTCEIYAKAMENEDLPVVKTVDPSKTKLNKEELGMVQTAVLTGNPSESLSAEKALSVFLDKENGSGSDAGYLTFTELTANDKKFTVVRVTYYPGENEYGALFTYKKLESGYVDVSLIGQVRDTDVVCLIYPSDLK